MNIQFATKNRASAFNFIKKNASKKVIQEKDVDLLLNLAEKDILRLEEDPVIYGKCNVCAGDNYVENTHKDQVDSAVEQLRATGITGEN